MGWRGRGLRAGVPSARRARSALFGPLLRPLGRRPSVPGPLRRDPLSPGIFSASAPCSLVPPASNLLSPESRRPGSPSATAPLAQGPGFLRSRSPPPAPIASPGSPRPRVTPPGLSAALRGGLLSGPDPAFAAGRSLIGACRRSGGLVGPGPGPDVSVSPLEAAAHRLPAWASVPELAVGAPGCGPCFRSPLGLDNLARSRGRKVHGSRRVGTRHADCRAGSACFLSKGVC